MLVAVLCGAALATIPALWRITRVVITLVHELGHAVVGIAAGRRFTGFVVRGDMSGHAVTVGPRRGVGRVLTVWAGYPAPAIVGAVMVMAAVQGWAAPLLTGMLVLLLIALPRIRSLGTAGVIAVFGGLTGALWWWGSPDRQAQVVTVAGVLLIIGAWRHLAAVAVGRREPGSDPAVLSRLTGVPIVVWLTTHVLVLAAASWWAVRCVVSA